MGNPDKKERRRHSRVGFATRIEVLFDVGGKTTALEANSKDLSRKGIFVKTDAKFPLDTPCVVYIYLTGSIEEIKLTIKGKTIRQTPEGIGILFETMDIDTYTHLKNIIYYNGGDDSI